MSKINVNTSVDDLYSTFKCSIKHYRAQDFNEAIITETQGQNRKSVIAILNRGLKAKNKKAEKI